MMLRFNGKVSEIMKGIAILVLLILVFALVGWITFATNSDRSSINLETEEIRQDTNEALENTKEAIEKGSREISETFQTEDEEADADFEVEVKKPVADDAPVDDVDPSAEVERDPATAE